MTLNTITRIVMMMMLLIMMLMMLMLILLFCYCGSRLVALAKELFPEEVENARILLRAVDLSDPHEWFPLARLRKRKIIYHGGKTYLIFTVFIFIDDQNFHVFVTALSMTMHASTYLHVLRC